MENSRLIAIAILTLAILGAGFAGVASAQVEDCGDSLRFSYSSSTLLSLYETVSPGGATVAVFSTKDLAFSIANESATHFFIAAEDQYGDNGQKLQTAGEVFYQPAVGSGFNVNYLKRAGNNKVIYAPSGKAFDISFDPSHYFSYAGRSFNTSVVSVGWPAASPSFGYATSAGGHVIVLTQTLDPIVPTLAKGSVFLESAAGVVFIPDGRAAFIGSCTPSCSAPSYLDYYQNSSCSSNLVHASDYCGGQNDLVKFYCAPSQYCAPQHFSCPFGCANGKCINGDLASCTDTNNGLNLAQRGHVSGTYANGSGFSFYDSCSGASKVQEYWCENGKVLKQQVFDCPGNGACDNGACTPHPTTPTCVDTDGGKNFEVAGTCSDSTGSYKDVCTPDGIKEYYCDAGYCKSTVSPCSSCSNGACPKSELLPASSLGLFALVVAIIVIAAFLLTGRKEKPHAHDYKKK